MPHRAQHFSARRPAESLAEAIHKPEHGERRDGGGLREEHVDGPDNEEAGGEEPAGADLIRQHSADELTDGICQSLTARDQT